MLLTVMDVKSGNCTNFLSKGMITERQFSSLFHTTEMFWNSALFHFVAAQNNTFTGSSKNAVIKGGGGRS